MYHFSQYGLYEYPFTWLVKCKILVGYDVVDTSVPCLEWQQSFDHDKALEYGSQRTGPLATWDFLTRVRGGILESSSSTNRSQWATRWRELVDEISTVERVARYFVMSTNYPGSINGLQRECTRRRRVVRDHIENSQDLRDVLSSVMDDPEGTRYWPAINGPMRGSTNSFICVGISTCTGGLCGCTEVDDTDFESTGDPDINPASLAKKYLRDGTDEELVVTNDFLSTGSIRPSDMKIPAFRFAAIGMDALNQKISVPQGYARTLLDAARASSSAFMDLEINNCLLVNIDAPEFKSTRKCVSDDPGEDPLIAQAEASFPGGEEELAKSRARPPYVLIAMGTDTETWNWATGLLGMDNPPSTPFLPTVGYRLYGNTVPDLNGKSIYYPANQVGVGELPSHGATVIDLRGNYRSSKNLYRYITSQSAPDSWCGLVSPQSSRSDPCGSVMGPYLYDCPQYTSGYQAGGAYISRTDRFNGQTCIHDHSCTLTSMGEATWYNVVPAPGGDLLGYPQDVLPIRQLWRWHGRTDALSKFYLPVGVFLQTYTQSWGTDEMMSRLRDVSYNAPLPIESLGMWQMCPHMSSTVPGDGTDPVDAAKSRSIQGENLVGFADNRPWQFDQWGSVASSTYCPASEGGIKECNVYGFRSYRLGLLPGYTMSPTGGCPSGSYGKMPVQRGVWKCVQCTWWQPTYCQGLHECMYKTNPFGWAEARFIPDALVNLVKNTGDRSFFDKWVLLQSGAGVNTYRRGLSDELAIEAAIYALTNEAMEANGGTNLVYTSVPSMPMYDRERAVWNPQNPFENFNPGGNLVYESNLPPKVDGSRCSSVTEERVGYDQCGFDDNYDALIDSVNTNMRVPEGLIIPPRTRAAYWTDKAHMLADGIPSWSKSKRDPRETFVQTITNKTLQCTYASVRESICSVSPSGDSFEIFNPWLGGAFNVFERSDDGSTGGCDTTLLDDDTWELFGPSVSIDVQCTVYNPPVCVGERLSDSQAGFCAQRQGQAPRVMDPVPRRSKHNLCTQRPPSKQVTCNHRQGMLYGLQGQPIRDLHTTMEHGIMGQVIPFINTLNTLSASLTSPHAGEAWWPVQQPHVYWHTHPLHPLWEGVQRAR